MASFCLGSIILFHCLSYSLERKLKFVIGYTYWLWQNISSFNWPIVDLYDLDLWKVMLQSFLFQNVAMMCLLFKCIKLKVDMRVCIFPCFWPWLKVIRTWSHIKDFLLTHWRWELPREKNANCQRLNAKWRSSVICHPNVMIFWWQFVYILNFDLTSTSSGFHDNILNAHSGNQLKLKLRILSKKVEM